MTKVAHHIKRMIIKVRKEILRYLIITMKIAVGKDENCQPHCLTR